MTDRVSKTKTADATTSGRKSPDVTAMAAREAPRASEPVSPMKTEAGCELCTRKPQHAPAMEAPNTPRPGGEAEGRGGVDHSSTGH